VKKLAFIGFGTVGLLVLAAIVLWVSDNSIELPSFGLVAGSASLPVAHVILISLVSGLVGGVAANFLGLGRRGPLVNLVRQRSLESINKGNTVASGQGATNSGAADPVPSASPPDTTLGSDDADPYRSRHFEIPTENRLGQSGTLPFRSAYEPQAGPLPEQFPRAESPHAETEAPAMVTPNLSEIVAGYQKVASGIISRSAFDNYFATLGPSGPVEVIDEGRSIRSSSDPEAFLLSVHVGRVTLVFPAYSFISNRDLQFSTIASVPEVVSTLFSLVRGSGEVIVDSPAVFVDSEPDLKLWTKGEIKGFAG
jgi:hypothetical protein